MARKTAKNTATIEATAPEPRKASLILADAERNVALDEASLGARKAQIQAQIQDGNLIYAFETYAESLIEAEAEVRLWKNVVWVLSTTERGETFVERLRNLREMTHYEIGVLLRRRELRSSSPICNILDNARTHTECRFYDSLLQWIGFNLNPRFVIEDDVTTTVEVEF